MSKAQEVVNALVDLLGDKLPEDIKGQLDGMNFISDDDANSRAKSERERAQRKADKAIAEANAKIEDLTSQIEDMSAKGGSNIEKDLERSQKKLSDALGKISELEGNLQSTQRNALIASATAGLNFVDGLSSTVRDLAIQEHFKDLSNEDLQDANLVADALKTFEASNTSIITTSKPSGAGTGNGASSDRRTQSISSEQILSGNITREQLDKAWEAHANGTLD